MKNLFILVVLLGLGPVLIASPHAVWVHYKGRLSRDEIKVPGLWNSNGEEAAFVTFETKWRYKQVRAKGEGAAKVNRLLGDPNTLVKVYRSEADLGGFNIGKHDGEVHVYVSAGKVTAITVTIGYWEFHKERTPTANKNPVYFMAKGLSAEELDFIDEPMIIREHPQMVGVYLGENVVLPLVLIGMVKGGQNRETLAPERNVIAVPTRLFSFLLATDGKLPEGEGFRPFSFPVQVLRFAEVEATSLLRLYESYEVFGKWVEGERGLTPDSSPIQSFHAYDRYGEVVGPLDFETLEKESEEEDRDPYDPNLFPYALLDAIADAIGVPGYACEQLKEGLEESLVPLPPMEIPLISPALKANNQMALELRRSVTCSQAIAESGEGKTTP